MATGKIKSNFKMPTPTAAERLHAQQQKNRKAAGLPDPSEYKKKLDAMKSENYEEDDGPLSQEQLDEISAQLKASYVSGAKKQIKQSMPFTKKTDEYRDIAKNFIAKRQKGIAKANEEVEQLDEYESKSGVYKHKGKYGTEYTGKTIETLRQKDAMDLTSLNKGLTSRLEKGMDVNFGRKTYHQAQNKNHLMNVHKNLPEEKVEESFRIGGMGSRGGNIHMYGRTDTNPGPKDGSELENVPFHAKTEKQKKLQNALTDLGKKMKEIHPKLKEGNDDITVFKKGSNVKQKIKANSYDTFKFHGFRKVSEAKDPQEYDYEGDMAKSDLRSIMHHAKELHDMIEDTTNLAEWCQSKITLAEDYLSTVANYMRSEMNEEVKKNEYHIAGKHKFPTKDEHAVTVKHTESGREHVHSGKGKYLSKLIKTRYNINHYFEEVELDEGRASQRHPLEGHEYHKKSNEALVHIAKDAHAAAEAMKSHNPQAENKYRDQANDSATVRHFRKTSGMPDWYKKKYGHVKEEVEQLDEKKNLPGLWANIRAKKARGESPAKPGDKDYPEDLESVRSGGKKSVKESYDVPFNKPYNKDSGTTTDKSGAKHTPMSKARHLARQAMSKTANKPVKESASEPTEGEIKGKQGYSRKAQIVMNASKGKKSDSPEKYQKDPELSSEIHKT